MKKALLIASVFCFVLAMPAFAAGDAAAGKDKSASCAGCHGVDGNSAAPNFPKLAGQNESYLIAQMEDFKSGARADATMGAMVAALAPADMADISAYFASQTGTKGKAAEDQISVGEMVFRAGNSATGVSACGACHGPTGAGNPQAGFPALAGQHAAYTADQLKKFRKGDRANDAGAMMRDVAGKMTDAEIKAVAQYVQGLQ